ncbi:MAG: damage-inducible protein DinB [Rhodobacteraceae bacterium]|nr:damage-inducible protein DinB [Paracoccaceae bacterium]
MITSDYVRLMARYNHWQNDSLIQAAEILSEEERCAARGAFFGSIQGTFSHVLWGDRMWMSRFAGMPKPVGGIPGSAELFSDWEAFKKERAATDMAIMAWAAGGDAEWLAGDLTWFSGATGREITKPCALLVTHFFNHQTHHRGQIHAMLTAVGAKPEDTDLPFMPEGA